MAKNILYKSHWRWLLFLSALVVFVFILYYSSKLINNIAQEERQRIEIWAGAITYKAQIVNETEHFFNSIRMEEGNHATLLAKAIKKVTEADLDEDLTFYQDIITSNSTVPTIIANMKGDIDAAVNVPDSIQNMRNISELGAARAEYDSLKLTYYAHDYVTIYYKESQIYYDLHTVIDNLLQSFFQETVINSASVPVIITDSTQLHVINAGNIDSTILTNPTALAQKLASMKGDNEPIELDMVDQGRCYVFYEESSVLKQLRYFPFIELGIVLIFIIVAYLLFSVSRKSEQNRVWVGMSKETAHQLGTPISSLMAWNELLKEMDIDPSVSTEIGKDVHRLETIAQRFSKIGSAPVLESTDIISIIDDFTSYMQSRIPSLVSIKFNKPDKETLMLPINRYLFEWVIENLIKNAVDAMDGQGAINIDIVEDNKHVCIDVADTGKGIPAKLQRQIFKPGYTSKNRGWGLGLTLAKRIINEYHKGKLFVKSSVIDHGTVMRIQLQKQ
ncbi:MAG: HAMP domain-containing histidine kinase [Bacteroidales bacterium]|nr:HAMP domain-containing histidine kinase [Bacteroidales bacterium]